jgi:membrane protease YdiL (CAAX protease family)
MFLAVAYGIAIAVGSFILLTGGFRTPFALPALLIMMFSPSLGAILATRLVDHKSLRVNGIAKGRLVHYLFGWTYPFIVTLIGLVLVSALGTATLSFDNLVEVMPTVPGISRSTLAVLTTVNLLLAPFINFVPSLGEEYGWRGFLQPILTGYQLFHNYVRPHEALKGLTPSEAAGIEVKGENKWITIIQNATMKNRPRGTRNMDT